MQRQILYNIENRYIHPHNEVNVGEEEEEEKKKKEEEGRRRRRKKNCRDSYIVCDNNNKQQQQQQQNIHTHTNIMSVGIYVRKGNVFNETESRSVTSSPRQILSHTRRIGHDLLKKVSPSSSFIGNISIVQTRPVEYLTTEEKELQYGVQDSVLIGQAFKERERIRSKERERGIVTFTEAGKKELEEWARVQWNAQAVNIESTYRFWKEGVLHLSEQSKTDARLIDVLYTWLTCLLHMDTMDIAHWCVVIWFVARQRFWLCPLFVKHTRMFDGLSYVRQCIASAAFSCGLPRQLTLFSDMKKEDEEKDEEVTDSPKNNRDVKEWAVHYPGIASFWAYIQHYPTGSVREHNVQRTILPSDIHAWVRELMDWNQNHQLTQVQKHQLDVIHTAQQLSWYEHEINWSNGHSHKKKSSSKTASPEKQLRQLSGSFQQQQQQQQQAPKTVDKEEAAAAAAENKHSRVRPAVPLFWYTEAAEKVYNDIKTMEKARSKQHKQQQHQQESNEARLQRVHHELVLENKQNGIHEEDMLTAAEQIIYRRLSTPGNQVYLQQMLELIQWANKDPVVGITDYLRQLYLADIESCLQTRLHSPTSSVLITTQDTMELAQRLCKATQTIDERELLRQRYLHMCIQMSTMRTMPKHVHLFRNKVSDMKQLQQKLESKAYMTSSTSSSSPKGSMKMQIRKEWIVPVFHGPLLLYEEEYGMLEADSVPRSSLDMACTSLYRSASGNGNATTSLPPPFPSLAFPMKNTTTTTTTTTTLPMPFMSRTSSLPVVVANRNVRAQKAAAQKRVGELEKQITEWKQLTETVSTHCTDVAKDLENVPLFLVFVPKKMNNQNTALEWQLSDATVSAFNLIELTEDILRTKVDPSFICKRIDLCEYILTTSPTEAFKLDCKNLNRWTGQLEWIQKQLTSQPAYIPPEKRIASLFTTHRIYMASVSIALTGSSYLTPLAVKYGVSLDPVGETSEHLLVKQSGPSISSFHLPHTHMVSSSFSSSSSNQEMIIEKQEDNDMDDINKEWVHPVANKLLPSLWTNNESEARIKMLQHLCTSPSASPAHSSSVSFSSSSSSSTNFSFIKREVNSPKRQRIDSSPSFLISDITI